MTLATALLVGGIGLLIGTVGLGGFLLVPVLMLLEGAAVHQAVVVAAAAFFASGLVSLLLWRQRTPAQPSYRAFLLGAAPGAMGGALVVTALAGGVLTLLIAGAFLCAGICEWLGWPRTTRAPSLPRVAAAAGGAAAGFGSALTGTSGPMVALPLLAWAGMPLRERIALAQVAQIPIALGATLMFASLGDVPWLLAAWSSLALCTGLALGIALAPRAGVTWLRRLAALLMIGAATAMLARF